MTTTVALQSIAVNTDKTLDVQHDVQATTTATPARVDNGAGQNPPLSAWLVANEQRTPAPVGSVDLSPDAFPSMHHFLVDGTVAVDGADLGGQNPTAVLLDQIREFSDSIEAAMANLLKGGL